MRYRAMRFPDGKPKAVTFSYDDGCRADIKLSQLFNRYGLKATFNLNSKFLGKSETDWHLTKEEIQKYIIDTGHEIAVHGEHHRANGVLRPIEGITDVLNCRLDLEKHFGMIIRGMAYPDSGIRIFGNGTTIESITAYLKELDIVYSRTLGEINSSFNLPVDWHQWMPTAHHDNSEVLDLVEKFTSMDVSKIMLSGRVPKLFYLWGHAYEFDNNNNWERMEEICEKLSGKDDCWYATNIEIYEYVQAYSSLVFSADSSIIYNPTQKQIWFDVDGTLHTIKPNETLKIS